MCRCICRGFKQLEDAVRELSAFCYRLECRPRRCVNTPEPCLHRAVNARSATRRNRSDTRKRYYFGFEAPGGITPTALTYIRKGSAQPYEKFWHSRSLRSAFYWQAQCGHSAAGRRRGVYSIISGFTYSQAVSHEEVNFGFYSQRLGWHTDGPTVTARAQ